MKAAEIVSLFHSCIAQYHVSDDVDAVYSLPFSGNTLQSLLWQKCWIDAVQWHLEDHIRRPDLSNEAIVAIKRRIDASNQKRTDVVEQIDDALAKSFAGITPLPHARMNSESPAWLLDRLSILCLKIWHMREQTERKEASFEHLELCRNKLAVLLVQETDMCRCFDELIEEVGTGVRYFKVYRQMKMYNDKSLNPALYQAKS